MKRLIFLTVILAILFPFHTALAKKPVDEVVRLTASQVTGANDIEKAILKATEWGKHPGIVVLDGSKGSFTFSAPDKSLNIFVSGITLRGENNAVISNCEDGLYFEGPSIRDVLIDNIAFACTGDGLEAHGEFKNVTLSHVAIKAGQFGIVSTGASSSWKITDSKIESVWDAMRLTGARGFDVTKNELRGSNGVTILISSNFVVKNNTIVAHDQGVLLGQSAKDNTVQANKISGVNLAGVALEPNTSHNRVLANKVSCAPQVTCKSVDSPQAFGELRDKGEGDG